MLMLRFLLTLVWCVALLPTCTQQVNTSSRAISLSRTLSGSTSVSSSIARSASASNSQTTSLSSSRSEISSLTMSSSRGSATTTRTFSHSNSKAASLSTSLTQSVSHSVEWTRSQTPSASTSHSGSSSASRSMSLTGTESSSATASSSISATEGVNSESVSSSRTMTPVVPPTKTKSHSTTKTISSSPTTTVSASVSESVSKTKGTSSRTRTVSMSASAKSPSSAQSLTASLRVTHSPSGTVSKSASETRPMTLSTTPSSTVSNSASETRPVTMSTTSSMSLSTSLSATVSATATASSTFSTSLSVKSRSVTPSNIASASLSHPPTRTRTTVLSRSVTVSSSSSTSQSGSASLTVSTTKSHSLSLSGSLTLTHDSSASESTTMSATASATSTSSVSSTRSASTSTTTSLTNSSHVTTTGSQSASPTIDDTMTRSLTSSANVSITKGTGSVSTTASSTLSKSRASPTVTHGDTQSLPVTVSKFTVSSSRTSNITASRPLSRSVTESEMGTATKSTTSTSSVSSTTSTSKSFSKMLSASFGSLSPSSTASRTANVSMTASEDPSSSMSMTVTEQRTNSCSPEVTASRSKSQLTITETQSDERSRTRTQPTSTKSFEHPITTSVPLIWREQGTLRFLTRPTRYAAPFRPIPIAPSLIFQLRGLAAIGEQIYRSPVGLSCYMTITKVATRTDSSQSWGDIPHSDPHFRGVWLQGQRVFPMVQSVCSFPNFQFQVPLQPPATNSEGRDFALTTEYLVTVSFCANTSKMIDPRVPVHPCNMSSFHVAACPYTPEPAYAVTTNPSPLLMQDVVGVNGTVNTLATPYASIFASNRSGNGRIVVEMIGGSFIYSANRNTYSCGVSEGVADVMMSNSTTSSGISIVSSEAYLVDMCHLRCIFDEAAWSPLAVAPSTNATTTTGWDQRHLASSALLASVVLLDRSVAVASTCTGEGRRMYLSSLLQPSTYQASSEMISCTAVNQPHTLGITQYQPDSTSMISLQNASGTMIAFTPTGCFLRIVGSLEPRKFLVRSGSVLHDAPITLRKNQTSFEGMPLYVALCDAAGNAYPPSLLNVSLNNTLHFVDVAITSTSDVAGVAATVPGVNMTSDVVGRYSVVPNVVDDGAIFSMSNLQLPTPPFGADGASNGCNSQYSWTVPSTASSPSTHGLYAGANNNVATIGSSYRTPLVLFPSSIFGRPLYATICVSVVVGEVTGIILLNADTIMRITDSASSLYVTPILSITDALGNAINSSSTITIAFPMNLSVVVIKPKPATSSRHHFDTLAATANTSADEIVVNGVTCVAVTTIPTVTYALISTFPFLLTNIVISEPGDHYSLWVRGTQRSSASSSASGAVVNVSTVLWDTTTIGGSVAGFPVQLDNYSIKSSFCPPGSGLSTPFSVEDVVLTVNDNPCPNSPGAGNMSYNNTLPTVGGALVVRGKGFSYFLQDSMRCHVSNWNQRFSPAAAATGADPPGAVKVSFVSSCEVRCTLPAQPYPVNPSSGFAYNSQGQLVRSSTVSTNQIGQFRLRGSLLQWSSPSIALKVTGPPRQMDVRGWSTKLQNSLLLVIPTFSVVMLDATGNDLTGLDFSTIYKRAITLSYTPSSSGQLNGTSAISVVASTCDTYNGVAVFPAINIAPVSGEYGLSLDGRQLTEYVLLLTIVDNVTLNHNLRLLSPFPLCFVSVTLDRQSTDNGRFPVPVMIGAFRRNTSLDTESVDTAVTNVRVLAQVTRDPDSPLPSFFDGSLVELGVDLEDCNTDYGNCGYLDAGVLTFSSFRFTGIPGVWYVIMIRPQNASVNLSNASFKVRVPYCPVNVTSGNLTAVIQSQNESLTLPSGGVAVKGWRFTIPDAMQTANSVVNFLASCIVGDSAFIPNGTSSSFQQAPTVSSGALRCTITSTTTSQQLSFPGTFYDYCTARCFAQDAYTTDPRWQTENPSAVCGAANASSNVGGCCFNMTSRVAQCSTPLTATVSVGVAQGSTTTSAVATTSIGTFTFIGPALGALVVANVQASKTVFDNQQVVPSKLLTTLDTVMVSLIDAQGERLGTTIGSVTGVAWTAGYLYPKDLSTSPLVVPGTYTQQLLKTLSTLEASVAASNATDPTMMCLPLRQTQTELLYRNGSSLRWVHNASDSTTSVLGASSAVGPPAGAMTWTVKSGLVSIDNLALELPAVGYYDLPVYVVSQGQLYAVNATVYVTPGTPVRVCLATSFANSQIGNNELLDPQPLIYLRDVAGNIYQSLRSNQVIFSAVSQYNYLIFDSAAVNANISLSYQRLASAATGNSSDVWVKESLASSIDLTPTAEYGGGIDVVQYLFNGLKVPAVHSVEYRLQFISYALVDNVTSERLLIKPCDATQFAIQGDATCYACPKGLGSSCNSGSDASCFLCDGSTEMNVSTNYWRYSSSSEYAYSCPSSSCLGNTPTGTCVEGYMSSSLNPLCGACETGYAQDFLGKCVPCAPTGVTIFVVVLLILVIIVVVFAFIYLSVKGAITDDENDNHLVMMAKIFMNHAQVIGMLGEFRVNFTGIVLGYFNFVGAAVGGSGVSISPVNCLMPHLTFLDKMSAQLVLPVVVLLAVAASLGILHLRRLRKVKRLEREAQQSLAALQQVLITAADNELLEEEGWQDLDAQDPGRTGSFLMNESGSSGGRAAARGSNQDRDVAMATQLAANKMMIRTPKKKIRNHVPFRQVFGNASMILIFVLYQTILTSSIQTFNCLTLLIGRSGESYSITILDADVLVTCSGEAYENGMAIAMYGVFIYAVFLPLFTMIFVLHQARTIGWTATYHQFSFLIRGFRLKYWFWEFVVVFRKTGLRLLIATINDTTLQALLGIWFLTALFVLQTYTQPYVLSIHNHADQLCIMTALITLNIGLAFSTFTNECNIICGVFSILLVVCNISVLVFLVGQLLWGFYLRLVEEFGVDTADGGRRISVRNLKNILLVLLKRQHKMSPSFRTYTPRPLNRALAKSVLGRDAGTDSDEDGKEVDSDDDGHEGFVEIGMGSLHGASGSLHTTTYQPPVIPQRDSDAAEDDAKPTHDEDGYPSAFAVDHFADGSNATHNSDDTEMQEMRSTSTRGGAMMGGPPRQDYAFLHVVVPQDDSPHSPRGGEEGGETLESDPLNLFSRRR